MQKQTKLDIHLMLPAILFMAGLSEAAPLDINHDPLFLTGRVDPNVMLMIDRSGSMNNIVPETPYNPSVTYGCTSASLLSGTTVVSLRINYNGIPYIRWGSSNYDWGTTSGNGATGISKRCFNPTGTYNAALYADAYNNPSGTSSDYSYYGGSYLDGSYSGNYLNWYFGAALTGSGYGPQVSDWGSNPSSSPIRKRPGTLRRIDIAKTAAKDLVDSDAITDMRMGLATYDTDGDGGELLEVVDDVDASGKKTSLKSKIDAFGASGATPLAETLSDIGRYFTLGYSGNLTLHPGQANQSTASIASVFNSRSIKNSSGVSSLPAPVQYSCQKNFAVLLTDGRPQNDQSISTSLMDYDGDCSGAYAANCTTYDRKLTQQYENAGSDYLDDVAQALYEMDLRPDLVDPLGISNNLITFTIGFADDQVINDPLMQDTGTNGGGRFLQASNSTSLAAAFEEIATYIKEDDPAAAALSANSKKTGDGTFVFQAKFNSGTWAGSLIAYPVPASGIIDEAAYVWDASQLIPAHGSRNIATYNGSAGVSFSNCSNLTAYQQSRMSINSVACADRLAWLRGDQTKEYNLGTNPTGIFRARPNTVLGDIINSDPRYVKNEDGEYSDLPPGAPGKSEYGSCDAEGKNCTVGSYLEDRFNMPPMIYVGANDGMLHGFQADVGGGSSGVERFAYIPAGVFPNISEVTDKDYNHTYYVDGGPLSGDAYIRGAGSDATVKWRTVLVGGLNAGGRTVYAIDVTDPDALGPSKVFWEFNSPNASTGTHPDTDMGLSYSQPQIGLLNNGQWAAIFGNGYNSGNERAYLYIVNLATGALIKKIEAPTGTCTSACGNGLSTPTLLDTNDDKIIDYVYAGDLQGNLWKFDLSDKDSNVLSGTDETAWGVAYTAPLFIARNNESTPQVQPITTQPVVIEHPNIAITGYMVYFGTGSYMTTADVGDATIQSFYGIWDDGLSAIAATDRSTLKQQIIDVQTTTERGTTSGGVAWATQRGWYMDLIGPSPAAANGERVISKAIIRGDRVIFVTVIPDTTPDPCDIAGDSWLMELNLESGASPSESVFDINDDDLFDSGDYVGGRVVSGLKVGLGISKTPVWLEVRSGVAVKVLTGTSPSATEGSIVEVKNKSPVPAPTPPGSVERVYWLQLR